MCEEDEVITAMQKNKLCNLLISSNYWVGIVVLFQIISILPEAVSQMVRRDGGGGLKI